jgi:hypothetical protein
MFSRYIRPNTVGVGTSGAPSNTDVAAFKNTDGTTVVVMVNKGSGTQRISLGAMSTSSLSAYYMDNSLPSPGTLSASISGGNVRATLPAYSVVTFVLSAGSAPSGSTTQAMSITSTMTTSTTATSINIVRQWGQCGGTGWTGPTTCASPYTCHYQNAWYSQCF